MTRFALALAFGLVGACTFAGPDDEPASLSRAPAAPGGSQVTPPRAQTKRLALVAPPFDVASTAATLDAWPLIIPGMSAHAVTSFDRSGGNDDGFGGTYSTAYVDARGEHVIFDERGPGVVRTLWMTSRVNGDAALALGKLRFYFDGDATPRFASDADALFRGMAGAPFVRGLVFDNQASSGGHVSWAPLPFRNRLRITAEKPPGFVQVHFDRLPPDWDVESLGAGRSDDALLGRFAGGLSTAALEEIALDGSKAGAGTIDVLRFEPAAPLDEATLRAARIRIWFDGAATPQVDAPLGAFFGSGLGVAPVQSILWTMTPTAYESRLPMPYFESVRFEIKGAPGKLRVHVGPERGPRANVAYLEARPREERPTTTGADFLYVDERGAGKLVAHVLVVEPTGPKAKQWWEGDQHTLVDDARTPAIHGTGHEDDFLGGWSNEFFSRPFSLAMNGCPKTEILDTEVQVNARATMYRVFSGIPFFAHLRHSTEHGLANDRVANYGALTFLYRQPRERLVLTDAFDVANSGDHEYTATVLQREMVTSAFEGENASPLTANVDRYRPTTTVRFTLAIERDNVGVVLRRLYDASETPAEAAVSVDDVAIATVGGARARSSSRRWATEDTFIPAQVTRGKTRLAIEIAVFGLPVNAARFEARALRR